MKEKKRSFDHRIIMDLIITVLLVTVDRILKIYAVTRLKEHPSISLIKGILELTYLENTGAAARPPSGSHSFPPRSSGR